MGRCRRGRRKGAGCVLKSHKLMAGNVLPLHSISEGTVVCNIKRHDGDCGVLARASADYAIVISHNADYGTSRIKLPSGAKKIVPSCYCAEIRQVCSKRGSTEKSLFKAKNTCHNSLKRNTSPKVPGVTSNPVEFLNVGGGNHQNNGHASTVRRDAPPPQKLPVRRTRCLSRQSPANRQNGTLGRTALMWNPENYSLGNHQHIGHRTTALRDAPPARKVGFIAARKTERIRGQAPVGRIAVFMASRATSSLCRQAVVASASR